MGNDLKYGLVLGAVVLLIFVGYYAIRSRSVRDETKAPVVAKAAEAPREVNIFETPGAERAPASTNTAGGGPEVTMVIGQAADTTATTAPGGAVAVAPVAPGAPVVSAPTWQPSVLRSAETGSSARPAAGPGVLGPGSTSVSPPRALDVVPAPPTAKTETYKIQKGDTLGLISKKYYGTTDKWQKILDANKSKNLNPNNLVVGTEITIPDAGAQAASVGERAAAPAAASGGKTYTVVQGDTLFSISKKFYGDGNEWRKIYDANKGKMSKPDALKIGMTLTIP